MGPAVSPSMSKEMRSLERCSRWAHLEPRTSHLASESAFSGETGRRREVVSHVREAGLPLGAGGPALWSCSVQPKAGSPYSAASISFTGVFWGIKGFSKGSSSGVSDNLPKNVAKGIDVNFVLLAVHKLLPTHPAERFASCIVGLPSWGPLQ